MNYLVVWRFKPRAERLADFERAYGPHGRWAQFFQRDEHFLGTELLRPEDDGDQYYVTLDRWTSASAYADFTERWRAEYEEIDAECSTLTADEERIGAFLSAVDARMPG